MRVVGTIHVEHAAAELIRQEGLVKTAEALRASEKAQHDKALEEVKASHEKALAELKAGQEKALEAARTALALENEKTLKAREEALKREAAETMKDITGGLDQNIREMKEAFESQKKTQTEDGLLHPYAVRRGGPPPQGADRDHRQQGRDPRERPQGQEQDAGHLR